MNPPTLPPQKEKENTYQNINPIIFFFFYIYCKDTIRKKAQTISFVERGFERLGLGHQVVGFSGCSYMVKFSSPLESFSLR